MIPTTAAHVEQLAADNDAEISMGGRFPTVTIAGVTFAAVDLPRDPVALAATPVAGGGR